MNLRIGGLLAQIGDFPKGDLPESTLWGAVEHVWTAKGAPTPRGSCITKATEDKVADLLI